MRINNFILCDDIRTEVGNKKSLMGVYSKELSFAVTTEEKGIWPKELILGIMLDFSISGDIKKRAHKFKVTYSLNGVEKALGEGEFNIPAEEQSRDDDFQMIIYSKAHYQFQACGRLSHCVRISDASGKELARAITMTDIHIKENVNNG
jgi:hypothetical protein